MNKIIDLFFFLLFFAFIAFKIWLVIFLYSILSSVI